MDCGVRSIRSKLSSAGIPASAISAATTHSTRQSSSVRSATKMMGSTASPTEKPSVAMDSALPRVATNQRLIATTAIWLVMPWPVRRRAKMITGSISAKGFTAIARQDSASRPSTSTPRLRARQRSVRPPAQIITAADAMVPSA